MDTPSRDQGNEPRIFAARLAPHRSLSLRGFNILMGIAAVVSAAIGTTFMLLGAWPVFGFFGLDVLILYLAFRRNYLDARQHEVIELTAARLLVRRVSALGSAREYSFNPYWTRVVVDRRSWGVANLALASSGRKLTVGAFLAPNERARFAEALSRALAAARAHPVPS
ncbi:MAG: DUF2244 domain-containing protein [Bauldia sp.]